MIFTILNRTYNNFRYS